MSALTLGLSGALAIAAVPGASASVATAPRVYEQATPSEKHGADIMFGIRASADGNAIAFPSLAALADTPAANVVVYYAAHRSAAGWSTQALVAPIVTPAPSLGDSFYPNDLSDDLRTAYYNAPDPTLSSQDQNHVADAFAVRDNVPTWLTPSLTLPDTAGPEALYAGRSADSRHLVLQTAKQLMPSVPGGPVRLYELVDGAPRLASVLPSGAPSPSDPDAKFGAGLATSFSYFPPDARAISEDGSKIYFDADDQLYVRLDGTTTKLVSASHKAGHEGETVAGADARFLAATPDGSRVFFTSDQPLVDGPAHGGVYVYDLAHDTLTQLATLDAGSGEQVINVVRSAPDGSRIFFATAATLGVPEATSDPSAVNVFSAGDDGLHFVATLGNSGYDADTFRSGEFNNIAAISPDGRHLAFDSARVQPGFDNGGHIQVYEYTVGEGLSCVSCPPSGTASGDASLRDLPDSQQTAPRGYTADGTLFFESPDRLTAADDDDAFDVYARDADGRHLVSPGTTTNAHIADVSADGRDLFIRTHDSLTPSDTDGGNADIYDARIGGGLPYDTPPTPCAGEACRGPLPAGPPTPGAPGSLGATDTSAPAATPAAAPMFSLSRIGAAARSKWARTGRLTLSVRVSDTAVVAAKATAKLRGAKKASTIASASAGRDSAGIVKLTLTLSSKARSSLKRSGKLTVKLAVSCSDTKTVKHATVALRKTKTTKKAAR